MNHDVQLKALVESLRYLKKEGVYWDFKREYHKDKGKLLHDIICFANAEHDGERYIIFGVEDETMNLSCIAADGNRKTQSDVISFLKDNQQKFAEGRYPDIKIHSVTINGNEIDILIVSEAEKKPIYLIDRICEVKPHHIYTRIGDANTPINQSASAHDIERMWRHRFGLNKTAYHRAKALISNFKEWESDVDDSGNIIWHHQVFPEFTIRVDEYAGGVSYEWTRGEVRQDDNCSSSYEIFYHQTRLARIQCISFDNSKKSMVAPKWEPCATGRLYFYEKNSIELIMQLFHAHFMGGDHSKSLRSKNGTIEIPLADQSEVDRFIKSDPRFISDDVCCNSDAQYDIYLNNVSSFLAWQDQQTQMIK